MESAKPETSAYTDGEPFQREKRTLFARTWLPFCAAAQVANPGEFVSHSLGGWPLFVIRGTDGALRAFHNTCRHQQMPVIEKAAGRCDMLRCRYHGWTYDLAGALAVAPPMVAPPDPKSVRLGSIELANGKAMVFVRIEPAAEAPPALDEERPSLAAAAATSDAACNWKTYIEAVLAKPDWQLIWPLALRQTAGGVSVVRQIVPRSFIRTRVVEFVFGDADPAAQARITAAAAADKAAAEALQETRAAGRMDDDGAAVRDFRSRVAAASIETAA
jgi:phenylpropionate dioxygenase-like ring-hydroxylating dioxygenase large terminal subunit